MSYPTGFQQLSIAAPSGLRGLSPAQWSAAVPALRNLASAILVDCGAIGVSARVLHLAGTIDGVIFVVEAERERRDVISESLAAVKNAGIPILGVVLNKKKQYAPTFIHRSF